MAWLTHSLQRSSTGHTGGELPPHTGGGDDGERGDHGRGDSMPNYGQRLRNARLALAVFLTPIVMLFVSFTVVYVARRGFLSWDTDSQTYTPTWVPVPLPWTLLLANTFVLTLSSITMELARRAVTREAALAPVKSIPGVSLGDERHVPWLSVATVLGLLFLAGQLVVWNWLSSRGFRLSGGTSNSFVYILTAMHGIHLAGGILALMYCLAALLLRYPVESRRIVVDITSWYWHFMTGLWICILVLFGFVAQ